MSDSKLYIEPGDWLRLGATADENGVNFALFSAHAERVELCLFDASGREEMARNDLPGNTQGVWHGYAPKLRPGTVYGYRVHGPYEPEKGHRFNAHKLLLDPYARKLCGVFSWDLSHFGYRKDSSDNDLLLDTSDNAAFMPKAVVTDWSHSEANRPLIPWAETTLYELHVRGYTLRHPLVPELQQGKFAALAMDAVLSHIKALGVSAVELLPVHAHISEYALFQKRLSNYWGYNTLSYFVPHKDYLSGQDPLEFRRMVDGFHDAGLEVILDVVYNHTCEGDHLGPTLSFRGIDNASYYRLQADEPRYYINDTGCGNTLNTGHPQVSRLVLDSLRYWYSEMGVDGFRFDLATVLGRTAEGFDKNARLFNVIAQDNQLRSAKLIAEPWDIGPGGYQLGNFPHGWSEWNDQYRDCVRRFWQGEPGQAAEFAARLHGSSDLFEHSGRPPSASINYITSHDGFTLRDLVSYEHRHNEANGERNHDGHRDNLSRNFGVEGPSDDPTINAERSKQQRNFLATLLLSQGVPMLLAGDELSRTQRGNNNAYCQDNAINWLDWSNISDLDSGLLSFVRKLLAIRRAFPLFSVTRYMHADDQDDCSVLWFNQHGEAMQDGHWHSNSHPVIGYQLSFQASTLRKQSGFTTLMMLFNSGSQLQAFRLPEPSNGGEWRCLVNTADLYEDTESEPLKVRTTIELCARSMRVLAR